jgi:hypothetical protein
LNNQTTFSFIGEIRHDRHWWTRINTQTLIEHQRRRRQTLALQIPEPITFVLISCSKSKLPRRAPAQELYTGQLFNKAVAWAERHQYKWFIVSALHGLVTPDQQLDPYDFTIKDRRGARQRESWAHVVASDLTRYASRGSHGFLIMPTLYRTCIETQLQRHNLTYENPVAGLAIGKQMKWLANN